MSADFPASFARPDRRQDRLSHKAANPQSNGGNSRYRSVEDRGEAGGTEVPRRLKPAPHRLRAIGWPARGHGELR